MKPPDRPIRVGVSACLLGQEVRYDGGHRRDDWVTGVLGPLVEFVPVCPEVEFGLGVPRPPIRLEADGRGGVILRDTASGADLTERMNRFAEARVSALDGERLAGFVLKARSPSCGPAGVAVDDRPVGRGLFAAALLRRFPDLPVEDEVRLADPAVRAEFLRRVLARGGA